MWNDKHDSVIRHCVSRVVNTLQSNMPITDNILAAICAIATMLPLLFLMLPETEKKWPCVYETCFSSNVRSFITGELIGLTTSFIFFILELSQLVTILSLSFFGNLMLLIVVFVSSELREYPPPYYRGPKSRYKETKQNENN